MSVLIIIPARGGSKGIPGKNIKPFHGKPLLTYSVEVSIKSNLDARVIVSTDDVEIARVALEAGAEVPFMRPQELAKDDTSTYEVIDHVVEEMGVLGYTPEYILLLQPTSPLRTVEDLHHCMDIIRRYSCEGVFSVTEVKEHPFLMNRIDAQGCMVPFIDNSKGITRRQDFPILYRYNGAIYLVTFKAWKKYHSFVAMRNVRPYVMPYVRSVDIDDMFDWRMAELMADEVTYGTYK